MLFNTIGWERSEYIKISLSEKYAGCTGAVDANGSRLQTQLTEDGLYIYTGPIPAIGYKVIYLDMEENKTDYKKIIENGVFF